MILLLVYSHLSQLLIRWIACLACIRAEKGWKLAWLAVIWHRVFIARLHLGLYLCCLILARDNLLRCQVFLIVFLVFDYFDSIQASCRLQNNSSLFDRFQAVMQACLRGFSLRFFTLNIYWPDIFILSRNLLLWLPFSVQDCSHPFLTLSCHIPPHLTDLLCYPLSTLRVLVS